MKTIENTCAETCVLCGSETANGHAKTYGTICVKCDADLGAEMHAANSPLWAKVNALKSVGSSRAAHPPAYIALNADCTCDAFVKGRGFASGVRLPTATKFIREHTGRLTGSVPCWNRGEECWDSEIDIAEGA